MCNKKSIKTKFFELELESGNIELVNKLAMQAYKRNADYFEQDIPFFNIVVEEPEVNSHNSNQWLVGTPGYNGAPLKVKGPNFLKLTRNENYQDFENLLTHEMCHRHTIHHYKFNVPCWFYEGLAGYIGKQNPVKHFPWVLERGLFSIKELHSQNDFYNNLDYIGSLSMIYYLHKISTKYKIMEFLKLSENDDTYKKSNIKFVKVFNITIDKFEIDWIQFLKSINGVKE